MRLIFGTTLICLLSFAGFGQNEVQHLFPKIGRTPDFSEAGQKGFEKFIELVEREIENDSDRKTLDSLGNIFDFTDDIWDVVTSGCSWYCGGGPYKVVSSSALKQQGENTYSAENANDLSLKNAWVEGVKGQGIGEYLEYFFKNNSPRLHTILIYNGLVKSENAWKSNSRVKTLKLMVNGEDFAILNLADSKAEQSFNIGLLGHRPDGKDLILKFEILDVYPGENTRTLPSQRFFSMVLMCIKPHKIK